MSCECVMCLRVASLNSSQNCSRLSSILLVIWQINKLRIESADPTEDAPEMHHVEGAFVETLLPKAKSPSQDALLKLETEQTFTELSQESSMFVFKLGLVKLQCCLLMNGLVVDANEISVSMSYMLLQEIWVLKLDSS
ncbi:UDP-glucose:glycoprotein glucosyltransferase-like [Camellia sinensis]|uniref:UDP-glucose:glycoprotein glucosyltransferase-like n=1 Tax=Camellia sinensis TaxID=4442 RepID=UPI001036D75F|nr:UDP-glucose:glycoprotein glucosyltransferase-like [Camellia sinensis]